MTRPRLLDLDCGAGGIAKGYHDAGFNVVGVDIKYQPHYPYEFVQADAIAVLSRIVDGDGAWSGAPDFDAIHASPPCQDHMRGGSHPVHGTGWMLAATRYYLQQQSRPWVIENVPGAPMRADYRLCGCMFGLSLPDLGRLERVRWFETSWQGFDMREPCQYSGPAISVTGHGTTTYARDKLGRNPTIAEYRALMGGIDWMNRDELSQAPFPPQYGRYIGTRLISHMVEAVAS